ncbi:MAG: RluA family pseudouridine synthase [Burkholderiaceae bacterium]
MNQSIDYSDEGRDPGEDVQRLTAAPGAGQRVDRFLAQALAPVSRTRIQRWLSLGAILLDGAVVLPSRRLSGLEQIEVTPLPHEAETAFAPDPVDFGVVFEDEHLMVVDKPVGLVVHPAAGHWRGTLMNGLLHSRPDSARLPRAGIVHRLDKDTSGLMLVARSERAFEVLTRMLAERRIHRGYLALSQGVWSGPELIDAPIGRHPRHRLRMAVVAADHGRMARTHVHALKAGPSFSLLFCQLETGRTHQIRVHLSWAGHPLLADTLYGGIAHPSIHRQALHASVLELQHPTTGRALQFRSPLPEDFQNVLAELRLTGEDVSSALERHLNKRGMT